MHPFLVSFRCISCMMLIGYYAMHSQVHLPRIVTRISPNHLRPIHTCFRPLSLPLSCIHPSLLGTLSSQVWVRASTDLATTVTKRLKPITVTNQRRRRQTRILPRIRPSAQRQRHIVWNRSESTEMMGWGRTVSRSMKTTRLGV